MRGLIPLRASVFLSEMGFEAFLKPLLEFFYVSYSRAPFGHRLTTARTACRTWTTVVVVGGRKQRLIWHGYSLRRSRPHRSPVNLNLHCYSAAGGELAREGHQVVQFKDSGTNKFVAAAVDGEVTMYAAGHEARKQ
jgi:hypothetical protein